MEYTKEQLKAAYALNLCAVSISQIIEYNDINIMEQEYESILNNLNLEEIPKDEALLQILKQILDVVTYFRIEEGDKQWIDKEYQQKVKNALWSAVPNIGMIVAGGSPLTMGISLASQVGIGYMNYRRVKAEAALERDKEKWQLERSAIEQMNGLRRELFDTAWRLSSVYNYPDKLRLTERQIKQYNSILMDNDLLRKYERLSSIKESFVAYPPFWYHFGNTANAIARSELDLTEATRRLFLEDAKTYFIQYRESNKYGLLRDDPISSACALELVDLLDAGKDKDFISELLDEAYEYSGREDDILQLIAVDYLKINELEKAAKVLRVLVNEQYNTVLNSQLLSSLYVSLYVRKNDEKILSSYDTLKAQVGTDYLYPMPVLENKEKDLEQVFLETQRKILTRKYKLVFRQFFKKYAILFEKIKPLEDPFETRPDEYYGWDDAAVYNRMDEMRKLFANPHRAAAYVQCLSEAGIPFKILDLLEDMFNAVCALDSVDESLQGTLNQDLQEAIIAHRGYLNSLQSKLKEETFDVSDMEKLTDFSLDVLVEDFIPDLFAGVTEYIDCRKDMIDFILAEQNLTEFCAKEGLPSPTLLFGKGNNLLEDSMSTKKKRFGVELLGDAGVSANKEIESASEMGRQIAKVASELVIGKGIEFYSGKDPRIERYFNKNSKLSNNTVLKSSTLAIIDVTDRIADYDLLLTKHGIVPIKSSIIKSIVPYKDVEWVPGKKKALQIDGTFGHEGIDLDKLFALFQVLAELSIDTEIRTENSWELQVDKLKSLFSKK